MTDAGGPESFDDLTRKLEAAEDRQKKHKGPDEKGKSGAGFGFRVAVDIVAALVVGVGIGLLLDAWWGTKPWMMIVFFVLGAAAGMLNVFRLVSGQGYAAGYRQKDDDEGKT